MSRSITSATTNCIATFTGARSSSPGVVVVHDAVLQHFFLGSLTEAQYIDEFVYNYGAWTEDLARDLWRRRARSGSRRRVFPLPDAEAHGRAVARGDRAQSAAPRRWCATMRPTRRFTKSRTCSSPPPEPPAAADILRLRAELDLAPHTFLFAVFGHLRESKRLAGVLRAFQRARAAADIALLVAGDFASAELALAMEPLLGSDDRIRRIGHTAEPDFWRYASAADACINLRYPSAGETSGISIRLMGIGKPVIMTRGRRNRPFPRLRLPACRHRTNRRRTTSRLHDLARPLPLRRPRHRPARRRAYSRPACPAARGRAILGRSVGLLSAELAKSPRYSREQLAYPEKQ